jgi:hypothetical protein
MHQFDVMAESFGNTFSAKGVRNKKFNYCLMRAVKETAKTWFYKYYSFFLAKEFKLL